MGLSNENSRNDYTANGSQSVYAYTFEIDAASDLKVTKRDTNGNETPLVLTTDFTVSGVGEATGGNVTLVAGNLPLNYHLTIRRKQPYKQLTSIRNQGAYYPEIHEVAFDHFVKLGQQLEEQSGRAVKLPETVPSSSFNTDLPYNLPGSQGVSLVTDPTGTKWIVGPTATQIYQAAVAAAIIESLNGLGYIGETAFNIANNQATPADVTGFLLDGTKYRSFEIDVTFYRNTTGAGATEVAARQKFLAIYRTVSASWELVPMNIGGDVDSGNGSPAGVTLSITAAGQIQYVSTLITGTAATSKITFRASSMSI